MTKRYYRKSTWKPRDVWIAERDEARRRADERRAWETARDERMQQGMDFKEKAEDYCGVRIVAKEGKDVLRLGKGDGFFDALTFTTYYEDVITDLMTHIPHLDYDPRIVSELEFEYVSNEFGSQTG